MQYSLLEALLPLGTGFVNASCILHSGRTGETLSAYPVHLYILCTCTYLHTHAYIPNVISDAYSAVFSMNINFPLELC